MFRVPISAEFAQIAAEVLQAFRSLAEQGLGAGAQSGAAGVFVRDVAELDAIPDRDLREARRGLYSLGIEAGGFAWRQAVDHVRALEHDLQMQPPPVWSPLTLARAALEGAALTAYLFEPRIPLAQRLARGVGLCVTEAANAAKASAASRPEDQAAAEKRREAAERLAAAVGADPWLNRRDKVIGYIIDGERAPLDYQIGPQTKDLLPEWAASAYPLFSGAAHSRPWVIGRSSRAGLGWEGETATVMAAVTVVAGALEAGIAIWAAYLGTDATDVLAEMAEQRVAFVKRSYTIAHPGGL
jgi:hypothetical protein